MTVDPLLTGLTEIEQHNLKMLWNRERGQRFQVVEGKLTPIGRASYTLHRKSIDTNVQVVVSALLTKMGTQSYDASHTAALAELLFRKINVLSGKVYNRSEIPKNIIALIRPQEITDLRTKLGKVADAKRDVGIKAANTFNNEDEYKLRVEKVKFAQSLGVDFERNWRGTSGNYIGWNYKKTRRLLVFKPADEGCDGPAVPNWSSWIKNLILSHIPFLARRTCYDKDHSHLAEAAASIVDRHLDLRIVPTTKVEQFTSKAFYRCCFHKPATKHGSCQLWVEGAQDAVKAFKLFDWTPLRLQAYRIKKQAAAINAALPKEEVDKLAVMHILTANGDGHPGNYLITADKKVVAIDSGWSSPHAHPSDWFALKFMYDFTYLPHAKAPFSNAAKAKIAEASSKFEAITNEINELYKGHGGYSRQKGMMHERLQVLKWTADNDHPVFTATRIKTPDDFQMFKKSDAGKAYFQSPPAA